MLHYIHAYMNIYQLAYLDTTWLKESDLVIAKYTNPSLGVGYELAYAERLNKHILLVEVPFKVFLLR